MNRNTFLLIATGLITMGFSACKKGDTGPTGTPGEDGTANVIYSDWLSFQVPSRDSTIDGTFQKVNHLTVPKLTDEILNKGAVQVYFRYGSTVTPLPYTSNAGSKTNTIHFIPKAGTLVIARYTHDNTASVGLPTTLQFRYILIPGGVQTSGSAAKLDMGNYEAVKAALNLHD
jgi:hypothetical protein